jgi:hypothetical protein
MSATQEDVAKEKVQCNKWMSTVEKKHHPNEPTCAASFPFLQDTNIKDLVLARIYYNDKPYLAAYGTVESAWTAIAEAVASKPVFNPPPGGAAIHKQFDNLMEFVKKHGGKVPHRTGEDDEEPLLNYSSFWSAVMRKKPHMN